MIINNKGWSINMLKIKNVVKSNDVARVNDIASVTGNSGTYVKMGVTTHNQYNLEVSMLKSKYLFDTENNLALFNATDESIDFTGFETIGQELIICDCITMHDIIDAYATGSIQQWYEDFSSSHTDEESIVLARFLSAIGIEVWRNVECFDGIFSDNYFVSNLSRVLSLNRKKHFGKILKPYENPSGYLYVYLYANGKKYNIRVNRLVALTFYGEPTEQLDACHANTNKTDNRLFNLDLKTHHENIQNPITQRKHKETLKAKADEASAATSAE